jgi:tetratricopeptide (TPR) repeat protein
MAYYIFQSQQAQLHQDLARNSRNLKDFDAEIEAYRKSLSILEWLGDRIGMANVRRDIGDALARGGESEDAIKEYRMSLAIFQKLGVCGENSRGVLPDECAFIYEEIGELLLKEGHWEEALVEFRNALALRELLLGLADQATYSPRLANTYELIGNTLRALERWDEALKSYRECLIIREIDAADSTDVQLHRGLVRAQQAIAMVLSAAGLHEEALEEYRKVAPLLENLVADGYIDGPEAQRAVVDAEINVAKAVLQLKRRSEALEEYRRILAEVDQLAGDDPFDVEFQVLRALVRWKISDLVDPSEARNLLGQALAIAEALERAKRIGGHNHAGFLDGLRDALAKLSPAQAEAK